MRFRVAASFLLLLLLWPAGAVTEENGDVPRYEFSRTHNSYIFNGSFFIRADPACLLDVLFDYEHLKKYFTHVDSVALVRQGKDWYEVTYTYSRMFYKARSTFRRTLNLKERKVDYELTAISQSGIVTPDIVAITGYYGVAPEADGYRVTFFQEGKLASQMLGGIYIYFARQEAAGFLDRMKDYTAAHCHFH